MLFFDYFLAISSTNMENNSKSSSSSELSNSGELMSSSSSSGDSSSSKVGMQRVLAELLALQKHVKKTDKKLGKQALLHSKDMKIVLNTNKLLLEEVRALRGAPPSEIQSPQTPKIHPRSTLQDGRGIAEALTEFRSNNKKSNKYHVNRIFSENVVFFAPLLSVCPKLEIILTDLLTNTTTYIKDNKVVPSPGTESSR